MRFFLFASVFLLALVSATVAQPWPAPGDGFAWENVGDQPITSIDLAFDLQGRLWAGANRESQGAARLTDPTNPDAVWETFNQPYTPHTILPLGRGDTTISIINQVHRTTDDGVTWTRIEGFGAEFLYEVPGISNLPGDLRPSHILTMGSDGLRRSQDRGASWEHVYDGGRVTEALVMPAWHPHAGRLIAGTTLRGVLFGDADASGALMVARTPESSTAAARGRALEHFALLPTGRLLATGYYAGGGTNLAFYSDDGGATWSESATALREPADGIPGDAFLAVIGEETALAVGGRGIVYRTDDAGETWQIVGRVPIDHTSKTSRKLLVGPDEKLYVAIMRAGTDASWVVRTAQPIVAVAAESTPEASGARLRVTPNPASGAVRIALDLDTPEAATITVYDARGREVHTAASGARGTHAWEVDASAWAAGVYVAKAEAGGETVSQSFTVAR